MGYLLDTNVISEPKRPRPDGRVIQWLGGIDESDAFLSVLTIGEMKKGVEKLPSSRHRAQVQDYLEKTRDRFTGRILPITEHTFLVWGKMMATFEKKGIGRPALDSLLEATALEHDLILVTRNVRNFSDSLVTILNPWE
ncbi:MAG: type II toxin-antitoxin system VapC family toxin [Acidobacteria bacterium ACB1]|nr:Toxin FitB [Pyrinomonadaceae bacterium]MCE7962331.1 type II toxin-antitoxin system VapC family toxin [Acidobacteria bacterium ACB1]RIJ95786.1 MAG: VapC toxin family PIN domain ribonuclease [Acidobacteriota bacterium]